MPEPARDEARMEAVGGHRARRQPLGEAVGEEDVGELRLLVGAPPCVAPRSLGVVEVHRRAEMGARGDVDDAPALGRAEEVESQAGEEELAEMVEGPGHLDAVGALDAAVEPGPDVVDEHVEPREIRDEPPGEGPDLPLRREVRPLEPDCVVAGLRPEGRHAPLALGLVAPDENDARPVPGEGPGGHPADAVRRPRDETDPPAHPPSSPSSPPGPHPCPPASRPRTPRAQPPASSANRSFIPSLRTLPVVVSGRSPAATSR